MIKYNRILNKLFVDTFRPRICRRLASSSSRPQLKSGPDLQHFLATSQTNSILDPFVVTRNLPIPYINENDLNGNGAKVFIRTYGCQMNVNDTQITSTVLKNSGYELVDDINDAEIVFLMTCAIRENAETKVWNKLKELSLLKINGKIKQIGLLGCIAERLKTEILVKHQLIDIIAGPDSYRDLPKLLAINRMTGQNAVNVLLSFDETYSDIMPTISKSSVTAFVSIMRGCDNMCSYCIVPFTRGRERSRAIESIVNEVKQLSNSGVKEVTLLGQNVNSYRDLSHESNNTSISLVPGFKTVYKPRLRGFTFDILLDEVAKVDPNMRIRFTSPHPKDFADEVLHVIRKHNNICNCIHLPVQSGSNQVLARMRRGYTREAYLALVDRIRQLIPDCALSSDFICGFCGETDDDHKLTVDIMQKVRYMSAFTFAYSMRQRTHAFHKLSDDVSSDVKIQRVNQISQLYRDIALEINKSFIGKQQLILIENVSKKSDNYLYGRNEANLKVIVPKVVIPVVDQNQSSLKLIEAGDYVRVDIQDCTAITLMAKPICHQKLSHLP
ncbi:mitochondrial tRNA methylthiotransferase CDK5RAP1-like [Oppia nitens]|uniref:mitochondrial tRNA methylthiotransferase CDK5RAP1-like n=1 Tax=Oppia nitens TaxID=1686743 RepID=UPI0023DB0618|nr:mitochondrial tRNA methylthiotransferase CDK5RAP1-like [Oppia nitens]